MLFVSDDLLDDSDDEMEALIFEISEDSDDFEVEKEWISIWEICFDDSLDEGLDDEEKIKFVNEKTSKRLLKSVLKIHIFDAKRR